MSMPEEINRLVTDAISDWFFVTEPSGVEHLRAEGKPADRVFEVGHVMVDNLLYQAHKLEQMDAAVLETSAIKRSHPKYGVVTLHRPSNVDDPVVLARLMGALNRISQDLPLFFPVHPRTRINIKQHGIVVAPGVELMKPQPYMAFLNLWKDASVVLTDSGGLQEETTVLGVPCLTLRHNTERPITCEVGSNFIVGNRREVILEHALKILNGEIPRGSVPDKWDGKAAERIVDVLAGFGKAAVGADANAEMVSK